MGKSVGVIIFIIVGGCSIMIRLFLECGVFIMVIGFILLIMV